MSNVYPAGFTLLLGAKFPLQQVQISSPQTQPFLGSLGASFHLPQGSSISPAMRLPMRGGGGGEPQESGDGARRGSQDTANTGHGGEEKFPSCDGT